MDGLTYTVPQPDDIVICPYNSSHAIEVKRMPYHLMKCRRQHTGQDYVTCPFNAKHEMPKPELRYHISNCEDRGRIAADLDYENKNNSTAQVFKGCTDVPSYEYDFELPEPTEDWDSETLDFPRVGIHQSVWKNPNIIRNTVGLTKSEKKEFHQFLFQASENGGEMPVEEEPPKIETVVAERLRAPQGRPPRVQQGLARAGVGRGAVVPGVGLEALRKHVRPGSEASAAEMLMALARGKRLQSSGLPAPLPQYLVTSSTTSSSTESQDDTSGAENGQTVDDLKKQQKKLQKKLRQIQALEDKQDRGEELTPEEIQKTSKREEIEKALEVLNLD